MVGTFSTESRGPILYGILCCFDFGFETYRVQLQYGIFENLFPCWLSAHMHSCLHGNAPFGTETCEQMAGNICRARLLQAPRERLLSSTGDSQQGRTQADRHSSAGDRGTRELGGYVLILNAISVPGATVFSFR